MKLRRFTDAGVAKTRAFLAAVKESNAVDAVKLDGEPFRRGGRERGHHPNEVSRASGRERCAPPRMPW